MLFSKDYGNIWKVIHSTTFAALGAAFKWNISSISHMFFVWLVFLLCLFVLVVVVRFFSPLRKSKDKDKTFLHHESLQTISLGILLAKLVKDS